MAVVLLHILSFQIRRHIGSPRATFTCCCCVLYLFIFPVLLTFSFLPAPHGLHLVESFSLWLCHLSHILAWSRCGLLCTRLACKSVLPSEGEGLVDGAEWMSYASNFRFHRASRQSSPSDSPRISTANLARALMKPMTFCEDFAERWDVSKRGAVRGDRE